ncbi:MAG: nickel-dependent hydrogenase large subunit, partial [Candidatus Lokiarchaeota archaeon]
MDIYRGFEKILTGKNFYEIPKISTRICGLCHASQSIVSCKSIESIFGIKPSRQTILLRKLLLTGELIKSHSIFLFFQALPDMINELNLSKVPINSNNLISFNTEISTKFFELIKIGTELDKLFGGRSVHLISSIPGGIIYIPSQKSILLARKYLEKGLSDVEWLIHTFVKLFADKSPPSLYDLKTYNLMSLHKQEKFERYEGTIRIKSNDLKNVDFLLSDYQSFFDKDPELRGINFKAKEKTLVGPYSRFANTNYKEMELFKSLIAKFNNSWYENLLFWNFIRILEIYLEITNAIEIIENPILDVKENIPNLEKIVRNDGIGILEAPRGTLIHHYHINNEK